MSLNKPSLKSYAKYSSIGIQMFVIIGLGTFIGFKLDIKFPNKNNLFTVVFSLSSVILSIVYVVKKILEISKEKE